MLLSVVLEVERDSSPSAPATASQILGSLVVGGAFVKHFNLGTVLLAMAAGLLAWGAYDYFANRPINHETCGVTISLKDGQVAIPAFTASNRVPLKLINRSGRPVRIVGNNAC